MLQKLEMGYCPLSMRLGAGLGTGRAGGVCGTAQAAWARGRRVSGRTGAGRWALGASRHTGVGRWGAGRAGRAGTRALGAGALGAQGERARGARAAGGHALKAGGTGERQAGTRGAAGSWGTACWAAWARPRRAAGPMGCALGALSLF